MNPLVLIEYEIGGRILALAFWGISTLLGAMALFLGIGADIYLLAFFGISVTLFAFLRFIDILLFEKIEIYDDRLVKTWNYFGSHNLNILKLRAQKGGGIFGGSILFYEYGSRIKHVLFFGIDLLPVNNEKIEEIKKILVDLKVIHGDEFDWNL
jgi:hypothetical protein